MLSSVLAIGCHLFRVNAVPNWSSNRENSNVFDSYTGCADIDSPKPA